VAVFTELVEGLISVTIVERPCSEPSLVQFHDERLLAARTANFSHLRYHLPAALSGRHLTAATQNRDVPPGIPGPETESPVLTEVA